MTDRPLRPPSRSLRAQGLCKVTLLVPEGCAEGIRQFAQKLRNRELNEPVPETPKWQAISPSAELMVSPDCSVRGTVRDTLGRPVRTAFGGPSRCSGSLTRLLKGGLRPD